jgi:hypothetical protein
VPGGRLPQERALGDAARIEHQSRREFFEFFVVDLLFVVDLDPF